MMSGSAAAVGMTSKSSQQRRGSAGSGGPGGGGVTGFSSKQHSHSRSYPRGVGLDFRKLAGLTLLNYIDHHGEFVSHINGCSGLFLLLKFPSLTITVCL
jgi:hypothetical protein